METIKSVAPDLLQLLAVVITVVAGIRNTNKKITTSNELVVYRVNELEKKQDRHNSVITRVYKIEQTQAIQAEEIKHLQTHCKEGSYL